MTELWMDAMAVVPMGASTDYWLQWDHHGGQMVTGSNALRREKRALVLEAC